VPAETPGISLCVGLGFFVLTLLAQGEEEAERSLISTGSY
jgi:hypothetical protein